MWIRSFRWQGTSLAAPGLRGSFMPSPGGNEIDTANLSPQRLRELLPASGAELANHGRLIIEFVLEERQAPTELAEVLEICAPFDSSSMATYVMLPRPIPCLSQSQIKSQEEWVEVQFRALTVVELAFERRGLRDPRLVGRPVRIFDNKSLLLVFWMAPWGYPSLPSPRVEEAFLPTREFPGEILLSSTVSEAIARGMPEHEARFATDWAGSGPKHLDTTLKTFDKEHSLGPQGVAEVWLAAVLSDLRQASEETLAGALEQWEADLQAQLEGEGPAGGASTLAPLARLGRIADQMRAARDDAAEPYDHAERYWFSKRPESAEIDRDLEQIEASLDHFDDRLRNSIALAAAVSSATALEVQQQTQRQSEGLQSAVTTIGSLVLGPTLVFGAFGANVPLPLGDRWSGFAAMCALAVLSVFVIRFLLQRMAAGWRGMG
jgi:hypothetical protein